MKLLAPSTCEPASSASGTGKMKQRTPLPLSIPPHCTHRPLPFLFPSRRRISVARCCHDQRASHRAPSINPTSPRLAPKGLLNAPLPLAMVASAPTFGFGPNHHSCSQPPHSSVALTLKCCFRGCRRPPAAPYAAGPDGSPRSRCPSTRSP